MCTCIEVAILQAFLTRCWCNCWSCHADWTLRFQELGEVLIAQVSVTALRQSKIAIKIKAFILWCITAVLHSYGSPSTVGYASVASGIETSCFRTCDIAGSGLLTAGLAVACCSRVKVAVALKSTHYKWRGRSGGEGVR